MVHCSCCWPPNEHGNTAISNSTEKWYYNLACAKLTVWVRGKPFFPWEMYATRTTEHQCGELVRDAWIIEQWTLGMQKRDDWNKICKVVFVILIGVALNGMLSWISQGDKIEYLKETNWITSFLPRKWTFIQQKDYRMDRTGQEGNEQPLETMLIAMSRN